MERHTFQPEGVGKESVLVFTFESRIEPTRIDTQQRNSCYTAGIFAILHLYEWKYSNDKFPWHTIHHCMLMKDPKKK